MGLCAILNIRYLRSAVKYLKTRVHRTLTTKYNAKHAGIAIIFLPLVCITYLTSSKDGCVNAHHHCCVQKTQKYDPDVISYFSRNGNDFEEGPQLQYKDYLINPKSLCADNSEAQNIFLVIFVISAPDHFDTRNAIRYTWGLQVRGNDVTVRLAFVIGRPSHSSDQEHIRRESLTKGDIIQASFIDSYRNLTLKTMSVLHWASTHCSKAKYVMKIDDDVFINMPNLITVLQRFSDKTRIILGTVTISGVPHRDVSSKWHVDYDMYPFSNVPPFVHGPAYVISRDLVSVLLQRSTSIRHLWLEDVFITGICALGADAMFIGDCGFSIVKKSAQDWILSGRDVTGHDYSPQDMRSLWNQLNNWGIYWYILHFLGNLMA